MHDYLFTTEVVRFAFMFGVAVSMLLYERRHLTTGSIVVPGYIATFIAMPTTLIATFANAFISYFLVNKLLRRWFLLYGRTKFTVLASISILIQTLMLKFSPHGSWFWESDIKLFVGVGYVVPALIAHDMGRQGMKKTLKSVVVAGLIVAAPIALALAVDLPGINDLAPLRGGSDVAIDVGWIPIAVLLSAASAWGVARFWGLRSGGFMGAAFVAILLGDPWQVLVMALLAVMTYVLVTRFLMNSMILFGRRKFSAMLLVSASMSWLLLWMGSEIFGLGVQRHMDVGSLALTPLIVPGLLANDAQRTSPAHVLGGLSLATTFVLSMTWWIESLVERRPLDLGWKLVATTSAIAIFGRTVIEELYAKLRESNAGRRVAYGLAPAHGEPSPWYGFAFASYHRWAALHHEAATAAEQWLASMLGEPAPLAVVGAERRVEVEVRRPDVRAHPWPAPVVATRAEPQVAVSRIAKIRAAAEQARTMPVAPDPARLPQRAPQVATRRPAVLRGEFDAVALDVAERAGRPLRPADGQAEQISEQSDVAHTRAHQHATSDAREDTEARSASGSDRAT
jgi:poly-gamma-glutamate biosynthesis protein PgsC/CapC